jgi:hypothetical protein
MYANNYFSEMSSHATIFKTHEMRHPKTRQPLQALPAKSSLDNSILDTLCQMGTRSTVYTLHEQRHRFGGLERQTSTTDAKAVTNFNSSESDSFGSILSQITTRSTIYKQHERRHHSPSA